ncbi:MAG: hypothetical protein E7J31_09910 [Clostridium sp.]|nr:hypothetical protein [Clostridium sp.]MDU7948744.1 hypothetical protein [Clostridium sp.]
MLKEVRCPKCNKLIFRFELSGSIVFDVRCSRCKYHFNLKSVANIH